MPRFTSRVGRVAIRDRAIAASLLVETHSGGLSTAVVARRHGITARRALDVLMYARSQGWVTSSAAKHRSNAIAYLWHVEWYQLRALRKEVGFQEAKAAKALVSAYFWGRHA